MLETFRRSAHIFSPHSAYADCKVYVELLLAPSCLSLSYKINALKRNGNPRICGYFNLFLPMSRLPSHEPQVRLTKYILGDIELTGSDSWHLFNWSTNKSELQIFFLNKMCIFFGSLLMWGFYLICTPCLILKVPQSATYRIKFDPWEV